MWDAYRNAQPRRVLHIGWWLRQFRSFSSLAAPSHRKVLLKLQDANALNVMRSLNFRDIDIVSYQPNADCDELLPTSVVFADLIDSSANNVVLDCIARATPLVINRHAAVEEYLGPGYPLFYESLDEAGSLLRSDDALLSAHRYLLQPERRQRYSGERFSLAVSDSEIYRALPGRA